MIKTENMTNNKGSIGKAMKSIQRLSNKSNGKQDFQVFKRPPEEKKVPEFILTKEILWKLFKKHSGGDYNLTEQNSRIVFAVLRYFLGDENFNEYNVVINKSSTLKGLLIYGDNGVGKSYLFEIIRKIGEELITKAGYKKLWFRQVTARKFTDDFMQSTKDKHPSFNLKTYYKGDLYIDDLGFEKKAFNQTEIFSGLLFERHRNNAKTYVTTNSKPSTLSERYGRQFADRMPDMFNIIKWEGESYRG